MIDDLEREPAVNQRVLQADYVHTAPHRSRYPPLQRGHRDVCRTAQLDEQIDIRVCVVDALRDGPVHNRRLDGRLSPKRCH